MLRPRSSSGLKPSICEAAGLTTVTVAVEVDAEDAVADGLQDGVGLADEGAEFVFGAHLLCDVDAEAEHVGVAAGDLDELVAVGDDAHFAVDVAEVEQTLHLALRRRSRQR